ncbi:MULTISPECIES: hypothetical protein [unclassified Burkholderia]|uniref:hypothetical protein n=1 Tax=unclassified Burkholderia TaxID=2613784 RepID=UPI002AAFF516|nr:MULTISPECIES: hypothetical protein [unclassified Burkholderia]
MREAHGGAGSRLGECLSVNDVGLACFNKRFDELRSNDTNLMSLSNRFAIEPIATRACLHLNSRWERSRQKLNQPLARKSVPEHRLALCVESDD